MEKRSVVREKVLYEDRGCCLVTRKDHRGYSLLEIDFVFCGCVEELRELRASIISILRALKGEIAEALREHPGYQKVLLDFIENPRADYTIPLTIVKPLLIGVGPNLIVFRLPRKTIDALIEAGIVDTVKDWCKARKSRQSAAVSTSL